MKAVAFPSDPETICHLGVFIVFCAFFLVSNQIKDAFLEGLEKSKHNHSYSAHSNDTE